MMEEDAMREWEWRWRHYNILPLLPLIWIFPESITLIIFKLLTLSWTSLHYMRSSTRNTYSIIVHRLCHYYTLTLFETLKKETWAWNMKKRILLLYVVLYVCTSLWNKEIQETLFVCLLKISVSMYAPILPRDVSWDWEEKRWVKGQDQFFPPILHSKFQLGSGWQEVDLSFLPFFSVVVNYDIIRDKEKEELIPSLPSCFQFRSVKQQQWQ
jgi:hypothetical protein